MSKTVFYSLVAIILVSSLSLGCSHNRTDAEIVSEVQTKIFTDSNISTKQVSVGSSNGTVTLSGTVASDFERVAAANDASQVQGVKTVLNNLQLAAATATAAAPATTPSQVNAPIRQRAKKVGAKVAQSDAPSVPSEVTKKVAVVTIPEGTSLSIRLIDSIDSDKNKPGDTFRATLDSPLSAEGRVVVPKNADVEGKVQELKSAGHFAGRSGIVLLLTKLSFNGKDYPIETSEYTQEGNSRGKRTAATVGGGAAVGALIGGLTGGGKGALIGAGVGAGAGTGVQAVTKGQQVRLASESVLEFRLNAPVTVEPSALSGNAGRTRLE
jgi:BON domain